MFASARVIIWATSRVSKGARANQPKAGDMESRTVRTPRFWRPAARVVRVKGRHKGSPWTIGVSGVVFGFMALILAGTVLLSLPASRIPGQPLNILDSFFTSTSAVCLVGLVVRDTATYWSTFGEGVILALIQLSGLGIMISTTLILVILRRPVSFRDTFDIYELSSKGGIRRVSNLVWLTLFVTFFLELLGAVALWFRFRHVYPDADAWWSAAFHSVSAFNNAGFDITGKFSSLMPFSHDPVLLGVIALLIVAGGISVLVLADMAVKRSWRKLTPNSRIVLLGTLVLLVIGFGGFLLSEYGNSKTLGSFSTQDKLSNSLFQSVTTRTAGFNSIPIADMEDQGLFLSMALMFIGAATGSTAGGIKIGTFAVLVLSTWAAVKGYRHASAFGWRFSHRLVYRALAIAALSAAVIFLGTLVLTITEEFAFSHLLFEVVSAFGTVGLTAGVTPDLSIVGKLTIIVIMFIGRLGPLTLAYVLAQSARERSYDLPENDIAIG